MERTAEEILDDLNEQGTMPTEPEVVALCNAALEGAQVAEALDALERALLRAGWQILDLTTDDDEGKVLELVPPGGD